MTKFYFSRRGAIFLFTTILLADQCSKRLVWYFFPKWISVNTGMAWGLFAGRNWWWLVLSSLLLGILLFLACKTQKHWWLVALIWGGGVSNLFDRLVYGGVRDWIKFGFWPAFNLADVAITLGIIFLAVEFFD